MSRVPRIRFKGFEEDWEQRKLKDYLEVSEEKNLNNEYSKENVLSVSGDVGIVNQIEFQGRSFAGILVNNYGVVKTGYVVYTKSPLKNNPYGIIKANKGRDGIVSTLYAIYKPKVNVNSNFIQIYFEQNARMNNYMQPLVNKGAKNDMKISSENALKGNVIFPIIKEQDIIVDFFFKIDHLITLHQRKFEKLKIIKKSMLENLFPQNGEKTPKIRFSGFTEDWEQRKLGEIAEYKKGPFGSALRKDIFVQKGKDTVKIYEQQNAICKDWKLERYFVTKEYANKLTGFEVQGGDIIVSCAGTIGEIYEIPYDAEIGIINQALMRIKVYQMVIDKSIFIILFSNLINKFSIVHSNGSAIKNIPAFSDLKPTIVFVPSIVEQKKIGKCFESLDHLITLHQSKLEKLQKIKKSMLESMFV